jgi:hypothetical protein
MFTTTNFFFDATKENALTSISSLHRWSREQYVALECEAVKAYCSATSGDLQSCINTSLEMQAVTSEHSLQPRGSDVMQQHPRVDRVHEAHAAVACL